MSSLADELFAAARGWFTYPSGERRATGYLTVAFQAYQDGTASCDIHTDSMDQTIVSLGATRVLEVDGVPVTVAHGDVIHIPAGIPHGIVPDPSITDERVSLVFRGAQ